MTAAKHTPADDTSFRSSLLKQGGRAVAVVAASALVFWTIGAVGGGPLVPSVTDDEVAASDDEAAEPDDAAPDDGADEPDDPPADEPDPEPDPEPEPDPDPEPDDPEPDEAGPEDDPEPADEEGSEAIDPGTVSVQVLDGLKTDGGTAAGAVADELSEAGYRIVARNQAISYDQTTVLYNEGQRAAAEQIGRAIGAAEVREQPGNLSTQVDVHVVVGADRA